MLGAGQESVHQSFFTEKCWETKTTSWKVLKCWRELQSWIYNFPGVDLQVLLSHYLYDHTYILTSVALTMTTWQLSPSFVLMTYSPLWSLRSENIYKAQRMSKLSVLIKWFRQKSGWPIFTVLGCLQPVWTCFWLLLAQCSIVVVFLDLSFDEYTFITDINNYWFSALILTNIQNVLLLLLVAVY